MRGLPMFVQLYTRFSLDSRGRIKPDPGDGGGYGYGYGYGRRRY